MQNRHFLSETNVISILFSVFSEQENSKYAIKDMLHILHIHNTHTYLLIHTDTIKICYIEVIQNRHFLSETNVISILFSVISKQNEGKHMISYDKLSP